MIRSFRDLRVWQQGMTLVEEIYRVSEGFPRHEIYGLTNQLRRAAVSVPSNIAEGHTSEYTKEYLSRLSIAQASVAEVETQLELGVRLKYLSAEQIAELLETTGSLGRQLYKLCNALSKKP